MSYSRWSKNCKWYTYWQYTESKVRNEQELIINSTGFSYKDLTTDLKGCLEKINTETPAPTLDQLNEVKGYIASFVSDVEIDSELNNE